MEMFTVSEVASLLRVERSTVYRWIRDAELGCVKRSRWTRVTEEQLLAFTQRHTVPAGRVR